MTKSLGDLLKDALKKKDKEEINTKTSEAAMESSTTSTYSALSGIASTSPSYVINNANLTNAYWTNSMIGYNTVYSNKEGELNAKKLELEEVKKTIWPAGYDPIEHFEVYLKMARENLDQETYEVVVKEFDEAQMALARVSKKLATIVKMKEGTELQKKIQEKHSRMFNNTIAQSYHSNIATTGYPTHGYYGPTGIGTSGGLSSGYSSNITGSI